jgi:hypothetical protein
MSLSDPLFLIKDEVIKLTTSTISKTQFAAYLRTHSKTEA